MTKKFMYLIISLLIFIQILLNTNVFAQQSLLNKKITLSSKEYTLPILLNTIMLENEINISYNNKILKNQELIDLNRREYSIAELLDEISKQTNIEYIIQDDIIVLKSKPILIKYTISGIVRDSLTKETIPYATVSVKNLSRGAVTNKYGFYSLMLPKGSHEIEFSYMGYQNKGVKINLTKNIERNIDLFIAENEVIEVLVTSGGYLSHVDQRLSEINVAKIKELPNAIGEPDLLRSIQQLPGVVSVAEIGGGFNVRGGSVDQNLILLDEAIVYNASHMKGFFSVFNADILKDVKLYKIDIPASFGGGLSSVMDITQKEGNMRTYNLNGTIGNVAAKIAVEGPIVKDKASFNLSLRRSYVDAFFGFLPDKFAVNLEGTAIYFYDINAKINYKMNDRNRIYLSSYFGQDMFKVRDYNQEYGNLTTTLRYNHVINSKLFSNTSVIYSNYKMVDGETSEFNNWQDQIGLEHYQLKNEFNYYLYSNKLKFGFDGIYRKFYPGEQVSKNLINIKLPEQHAFESAFYLSNQFALGQKIGISLGIRYSMFNYLGPEEVYNYQAGVPRSINTITDTLRFQNNEQIESYNNWEPRISIKYAIDKLNVLKLSYNQTSQYIHLISNTITPSPYNMWKPSNNNIKPQTGYQIALAYFTSLFKEKLDVSIETFYREIENTLEIKPGADIVLNPTLDADLIEAKGKAYGFELLVEKKKGKGTISLSYAYIRSLKKANQIYVENKIFPNGYYPSDYDIPHSLSIQYNYKSSPRSSLTLSFTYMSGRPLTLPDGQYVYFGTLIPHYSNKNGHRMDAFHRLDLSYTVYSKKNDMRKLKGYWTFSLYNIYGRNNPYAIYLERVPRTKNTQAVKFSVLGSIVPSISYSFKI